MADGEVKVIIDDDGSSGRTASEIGKTTGAIADVGTEVDKTTEKFMTNRREVRAIGNEISEAFGLGRIGGLLVGGLFATVVAATESIRFLKETWQGLKDTINGPIDIGLLPGSSDIISTAAQAWDDYATARAKVIAAENSPESAAGAREKALTNELTLIKEVLTAEKEKALADLDLQKGTLSPEAYQSARANIENIFAEAGIKAEEKKQQQQISNKYDEAANLEIDAKTKTSQALGIKGAPRSTVETNENFYDEQSAKAEKALLEINDRIEFIKKVASPDGQADYSGPWGGAQKRWDQFKYYNRYGGTNADFSGNLANEEQRKVQAEALINAGQNYKTREDAAQKQREDLMKGAGEESGKAVGLRSGAAADQHEFGRQQQVDKYVASLHEESASKIQAASGQTNAALKNVLDKTLGGFSDIHQTLKDHERKLDLLQSRTGNNSSRY